MNRFQQENACRQYFLTFSILFFFGWFNTFKQATGSSGIGVVRNPIIKRLTKIDCTAILLIQKIFLHPCSLFKFLQCLFQMR